MTERAAPLHFPLELRVVDDRVNARDERIKRLLLRGAPTRVRALQLELFEEPLEQRVDVTHTGAPRELLVADGQHLADHCRAHTRPHLEVTVALITRRDALVGATRTARRD